VNGGAGADKRKEEGESDEGSSLKDKDSAGRDGGDGASKVKRRRGMSLQNFCIEMNEGGWV
jgi:hypothetical protein